MKASLVLLIGLGLTALLRRHSAAVRHWVLAAAVASAAILPLMEILVPSWPLPLGREAVFERIVPESPPPPPSPDGSPARRAAAKPARTDAPRAAGGTITIENVSWLVRPVWFAGLFVSLAILVAGFGRLAWLASRSQRLSTGHWVDLAGQISREVQTPSPRRALAERTSDVARHLGHRSSQGHAACDGTRMVRRSRAGRAVARAGAHQPRGLACLHRRRVVARGLLVQPRDVGRLPAPSSRERARLR